MTTAQPDHPLPWEQPGWDPAGFLDSLVFDPDQQLDEAELHLPGPDDKIGVHRPITMRMAWQTDRRVAAIAQERGMTIAEYLEDLAEIELARLDAIEARERARQAETNQHHAA